MNGPLDFPESIIKYLRPLEFAREFRRLILAECFRVGVPNRNVTLTEITEIPDGGIDADIEGIPPTPISNFLFPGHTAFQFKAGDNFSPTSSKELTGELFGKDRRLKTSVQNCINKKGTYVLICSGKSITGEAKRDSEAEIKRLLGGYGNVVVWGANHVLAFYKPFPQLRQILSGRSFSGFEVHGAWAAHDDMKNPFVVTPHQEGLIATITSYLEGKSHLHFRLTGEPGVGKTRCVFEATRAEPFQNLVLYCSNPEAFLSSELIQSAILDDSISAIFVVDDCLDKDASEISRRYLDKADRIRIITINPESTGVPSVEKEEAQSLTAEEIKKVLSALGSLPPHIIDGLVPFCDGSPRAAVIIGKSFLANQGDPLGSNESLWRRYIYGLNRWDDPVIQKFERVLKFVSLFRRFGVKGQYSVEYQAVKELYRKFQESISDVEFAEALKFYTSRKLFQGQSTYYISPKVLHLWLWKSWWDTYGSTFQIQDFISTLDGQLKKYFFEMFEYAGTSPMAQEVARRLLAVGSTLYESFLDSEMHSDFFLTLTKVAPEESLQLLEVVIGRKNKEELHNLEKGRRNIVWALEWLAQWDPYFIRSAKLLVQLAIAENESVSNNSTGVFVNLFAGFGDVGHTEALPEVRVSFLKDLLNSGNAEKRSLAFAAIRSGLESQHLTKFVSFPDTPFEKRPNFWKPQKWGELFQYYHDLRKLLLEEYERGSAKEKESIESILSHHLRAMLWIHTLAEDYFTDLKSIYHKTSNKAAILKSVADVIKYDADRVPPDVYQKVSDFLEAETESSFASRFDRYVIHSIDSEKYSQGNTFYERSQERAGDLAKYAYEHPAEFKPELKKLFDEKVMQGNEFGRVLGTLDLDGQWYPEILAILGEGKKANLSFCVAYFAQRIQSGKLSWPDLIRDLTSVDHQSIIVMVGTIIGIPNEVADSILLGLKEKKIPIHVLEYFRWGKSIQKLSYEKFNELAEFLLSSEAGEIGPVFCISLTASYFLDEKSGGPLPSEDFLMKILTYEFPAETVNITLFDFDWERLTKYFLKHYPASAKGFISFFFTHFGERGTFFDKHSHYSGAIASELLKSYPIESWDVIKNEIEPPLDGRQFHLLHWLQGHMQDNKDSSGALLQIPEDALFSWIDEKKETRASLIAHFTPAGFGDNNWALIRKLIIRYSAIEGVEMNIRRCFTSEGWTGPTSLHYRRKVELLEKKLEGETEPTIISWIQKFISDLKKDIEQTKMREERSRFGLGFEE